MKQVNLKLNKLKPLINLDQNLIDEIASFDTWADKI